MKKIIITYDDKITEEEEMIVIGYCYWCRKRKEGVKMCIMY